MQRNLNLGFPLEQSSVATAVAAIRRRCSLIPSIGLILGSGLGALAELVDHPCHIPFDEIPGHPLAGVAGHAGTVVLGRVEGVSVAVWQGRVHFYEGPSMAEITLPVRLLRGLGGRALLLTNAAGSLNAKHAPGDLMVVTDHLNLPGLVGHSPLRGQDGAVLGERFVDLSDAYDPVLVSLVSRTAQQIGQPLHQGIYAMVAGPSYETPAEGRFLRLIGADAVGMSTVPEVVVARQVGLRVMAISVITNLVFPLDHRGTNHADVLAVGNEAKPRLAGLLRVLLPRVHQEIEAGA